MRGIRIRANIYLRQQKLLGLEKRCNERIERLENDRDKREFQTIVLWIRREHDECSVFQSNFLHFISEVIFFYVYVFYIGRTSDIIRGAIEIL